jgi:GTP-binding protein
MVIKSASFIISNTDIKKCPIDNRPEYAFIGRSNVGKSSLINSLCNKKKIAKTSSRPGKTQLINHFLINENWYLVDLPGYGYAKTSKSNKKQFQKLITKYFKERNQLVNAYLLIDIRHDPQKIDIDFMKWLVENYIPFSIVFTKVDKLKNSVVEKNIEFYKKSLLENSWETTPPVFKTSSIKNIGSDELLSDIKRLNDSIKKLI